jgi:hypothetical protein
MRSDGGGCTTALIVEPAGAAMTASATNMRWNM